MLAHCPPGTRTTLSVRRAGNAAVLGVADNGPGVPQTDLANLFKPFQRLTDHDPAGGLSSGLGLSLAKQIIANAGGQLWYEDREGGGSRFVIELPEVPRDPNDAGH